MSVPIDAYCPMCGVHDSWGCACPNSPCPEGLGCYSLCGECRKIADKVDKAFEERIAGDH